mgnify:CR=1 FL=1
MTGKYAILIDGGYFTKVFQSELRHYPTASDVKQCVEKIQKAAELAGAELLRVYFYDAPPLQGSVTNPIDGHVIDLGKSDLAKNAKRLQSDLSLSPFFALRSGELKLKQSWKIKSRVWNHVKTINTTQAEDMQPDDIQQLQTHSTVIYATDIQPDITQKGVDLKIGIDIACMALRRTADIIILVSGDTDLVPALKMARKEGVRVCCTLLGKRKLTDLLRIHSDCVIGVDLA